MRASSSQPQQPESDAVIIMARAYAPYKFVIIIHTLALSFSGPSSVRSCFFCTFFAEPSKAKAKDPALGIPDPEGSWGKSGRGLGKYL